MNILIIIAVIIALLLVWLVHIYNKLIHMIEEVNNNQKQIDIQLAEDLDGLRDRDRELAGQLLGEPDSLLRGR